MLKKFIYIFMFTFIIFSLSYKSVYAYSLSTDIRYSLDGEYADGKEKENCDAIFGDPNKEGSFANYLQQIFNVFKYLAPSLVIVLSIIEFVKAIVSDDKDALMKATKKTGKRIILALLLFFIPGLINFLFHILGWYGTCGIS